MLTEFEKRLLSKNGYFERFFELTPNFGSYRAAWEALEKEYFQCFGDNRYSSYHSFATMKSRYLKKLFKTKNLNKV